jgi:hypothetical protein
MEASPIPPDQRWAILPKGRASLIQQLGGGSDHYTGRKGITTDLNGAYFVKPLGKGSASGLLRIRTIPESGRKPVPQIDAEVEASLVYPLLKGASQTAPFSYRPTDLVALVPNRGIHSIPSEAEFRREYPSTYRYLRRINRQVDEEGYPLLEARSTWRLRLSPTGAPFYAIYNVGTYTFSAHKVVWAEISGSLSAAVVDTEELPYGFGRKAIIPDHKIYFVDAEEDEAHFLCAMLNSEPVRTFVNSFTVKIQVGSLFRHLRLTPYSPGNTLHARLSHLSKHAHSSGLDHDLQQKIDKAAWQIVTSQ